MKPSKADKQEKTNVMRLLDAAGIAYIPHFYDPTLTDGQSVADTVGKPQDETFKTLVTRGASGGYHVFVIPVNCTLHLKKSARAAGEKSIAMIAQKELLPLTGYIHGGCSPIGMKKPFPTYLNDTAELFDTICCSAGRIGAQIELSPADLADYIGASFHDLTE